MNSRNESAPTDIEALSTPKENKKPLPGNPTASGADKPPTPQTNKVDIRRFLDLIMVEDGIIEVRAFEVPRRGTVTGYFDVYHKDEAVDAIALLSGRCPAIYTSLNPVNPALMSRAPNRLRAFTPKGEGVQDADILRRRFIPCDFDWVRQSGISSTDAEHEAALKRMLECDDALLGEGPVPILVGDSGNGGHLLLAVDLPNNKDSDRLVERFFKGLDEKFSDPKPADSPYGYVKFDTANKNPSRIWKCYGTIVAKGFPTADRPHRTAAIKELRTDE